MKALTVAVWLWWKAEGASAPSTDGETLAVVRVYVDDMVVVALHLKNETLDSCDDAFPLTTILWR